MLNELCLLCVISLKPGLTYIPSVKFTRLTLSVANLLFLIVNPDDC